MKKRRLTRKEKRSKRKKAIIISTLCLLFVMTAGYAAFQTNISITAKGNIKEPSKIIKSWEEYSNQDFHSDYYKENIVSVTFLDTNQVASNATESWDVSDDGKGGVKAWVVPNNDDSTKYDLYIGANGGVIANENSGYIFYNFSGITVIDFNNNFDTSNVTNMNCMFAGYWNSHSDYFISSLKEIRGLENFDTSNVTDMTRLFARCTSLETVDLSSFNTSKVTSMWSMFSYCLSLKSIDVSNFDTSNVVNMGTMFDNCTVTELNLCSFNTNNVTFANWMFQMMPNIEVIYVSNDWNLSNATTDGMFDGTTMPEIITDQCELIN